MLVKEKSQKRQGGRQERHSSDRCESRHKGMREILGGEGDYNGKGKKEKTGRRIWLETGSSYMSEMGGVDKLIQTMLVSRVELNHRTIRKRKRARTNQGLGKI